MKVVILDTKPVRRGAQIFAQSLAGYLLQENIEVSVIYLYKSTEDVQLTLRELDLCLGYSEAHFFEKWLTIQPSLFISLAKSLNKLGPDILLLNGSRTLKYGAAVKKIISKTPKLIYRSIDIPSFWNPGGLRKWYYSNFVMTAMDGLVGVSKASLRDAIRSYRFKIPSIVIYRSIEISQLFKQNAELNVRAKFGIPDNSFVLLFLGGLNKQKRPDRFIRLVEELKKVNNDILAFMVGDGPLRYEVEKAIETSGLINTIFLTGYQREVRSWISASDVLVLTSDTEGLPGVILEAAAFEVPAVAPSVGGVEECIEHEVTGFIVEPGNQASYLTTIQRFIFNSTLKKKMGKASRQKVEKEFTLYLASRRYIDFFNQILSGSAE